MLANQKIEAMFFLVGEQERTKEVAIGGGAEWRTPDAKAALPLCTPTRRASPLLRWFFTIWSAERGTNLRNGIRKGFRDVKGSLPYSAFMLVLRM